MRQHSDAGRSRRLRQPCDRCRDLVASRNDALDQLVEGLARETSTFDHAAALLRLRKAGDRGIHMVVECEQVDPSVGKPLGDLDFGIEIVGLVAEMEAGVRRQFWPQDLDIFEQLAGIIGAAQAGLPRPGRGMKDRGDAVCDRLPVAVDQRHIDGKSTPGRGIICRSKASPCRSIIPGSTFRPLASMPGEPRSAAESTATMSRPATRNEISTNSPPTSAWPPSIDRLVMTPRFVVLSVYVQRPRTYRGSLRRPVCGNRAGRGAAFHGPHSTRRVPTGGSRHLPETGA